MPTATVTIAPRTTSAIADATTLAPDGDAVANTAYASRTPLRRIARGPTAVWLPAVPKHGHGRPRACARTSTTVKPTSSATAAIPGTAVHHTTSATAIASSTNGRLR